MVKGIDRGTVTSEHVPLPTPGADIAGSGAVYCGDYELAERFAPYLYGHPKEIYWPIPIEPPVRASTLIYPGGRLRNPEPGQLDDSPYNTPDSYLNLAGWGKRGMAVYFQLVKNRPEWQPKAYARVKRDNPNDDIVIQYWFFYYDNPGVPIDVLGFNHHEGDWEMVQIVLDKDENPKYTVYSQHGWRSRRLWRYVNKGDGAEGTHAAVYVARGSHASYFRPYRFWLDATGESEMRAGQPVPLILLDTDDQSPEYDYWLDFEGLWGNKTDEWLIDNTANDGPTGPAQKGEKWTEPWKWGEEAEWDELCGLTMGQFAGCGLNNLGKFRVTIAVTDDPNVPNDVHVYKRTIWPDDPHVGWKDGQIELEIPSSEYFDATLEEYARRTIILHDVSTRDPYHDPIYRVETRYRPPAALGHRLSAAETSAALSLTLNYPNLENNTVITITYVLSQSWSVSSSGVISAFNGSDFHLMLDIDGDGEFDQDVPPTTLDETPVDFTAPAPITDLAVLTATKEAILLTWTAPGDDGHSGTSAAYDVRYGTVPLTDANWVSATQVIGPPVPAAAGTTETFTVTGVPGGRFFFAIESIDDALRYSGLSNVVQVEIPALQPSLTKIVTPERQLNHGDELTYTIVITAAPGVQVGLYDPLTDTVLLRFLAQPEGITHSGGVITGALTFTPTNQVTVTNRACIYPFGGTLGVCDWSNAVTNPAFRPYSIYLPALLRNY
jgi:hypothetical protein